MDLVDPSRTGSEAEVLLGFLDYQRTVLRRKIAGLDAEQLNRRLDPSAMTLGGMVKHLAYVEEWWLNEVYLDNPAAEPWASADWDADADWDWHSAVDDSPEELRRLFEEAVAASEAIVRQALAEPDGLESLSRRPPPPDRPAQPFNLRWILVHLIEEYARHLGHADLLRESIDGAVGD